MLTFSNPSSAARSLRRVLATELLAVESFATCKTPAERAHHAAWHSAALAVASVEAALASRWLSSAPASLGPDDERRYLLEGDAFSAEETEWLDSVLEDARDRSQQYRRVVSRSTSVASNLCEDAELAFVLRVLYSESDDARADRAERWIAAHRAQRAAEAEEREARRLEAQARADAEALAKSEARRARRAARKAATAR